ncbi:MAG: DUF1566 domain-containing protein [Candidatus Staskawiczbacteria bacterium]|nr:DUF1566 domain-containing protein [Candidatus Staskawiczbacteria bacterium]
MKIKSLLFAVVLATTGLLFGGQVLHAQADLCAGTPAVGTVCADGTVYVTPTLRTTLSDAGTMQWANENVVTGATSTTDGAANTNNLAARGSRYVAAYYCKNMSTGGHTDWYLPAKDELNTLYVNKGALGMGGLYYWSSTEYNSYYAWAQYNDGNQYKDGKYGTRLVRCVRYIALPTCTAFTYSDWGTCSAGGTQTHTIATQSPAGCTGGSPILSQSCTPPVVPTCTSFTYSDWGTCSAGGSQTRTVATQSPSGCTGGTPVLSRSCYSLNYTAGVNGYISGTAPQMVASGASGTAVTAAANTNYHFVSWSDGSTQNPRTDTNVTGNISVTATFAINSIGGGGGGGGNYYTISTSTIGGGSITKNLNWSSYFEGTQVTLTAVTTIDCNFTGWSVDASGTNNPITVTMNSNKTIKATFSGTCPGSEQFTFTRALRLGMRGEDVRQLQKFLNSAKAGCPNLGCPQTSCKVSVSGAGSPGNETTTFSIKTWNAVKKFQECYKKDVLTPSGLTKGTGFVGAATFRKILNLRGQ